MQRDIQVLEQGRYDLVIVGGGVYGAATALEAAWRGLSVVLLDQGDFCGATSANSLKIIHGGLRYLQQADIVRLRESSGERRRLMRMAPHLVHPLPCAMPTTGHLMKGREAMIAGLLANEILSCDRNRGLDPAHRIPRGRTVSRQEWLRIAPELDDPTYNGAALWHDACAYNSERLVIGMVRRAVQAGARVANHVEMTGFKMEGNRVCGVEARDRLADRALEIDAAVVINNTGPWINRTLALAGGALTGVDIKLAIGINVVLRRQLLASHAVGLSIRRPDGDGRLLFFMPWHGRTLAGTLYRLHRGDPNDPGVNEDDIMQLLSDLQQAWPAAGLRREDIVKAHAGVLPAKSSSSERGEPALLKHYRLIDHARQDGVEGLISVLGVKYTTAYDVAERTVRRAATKLARKLPRLPADRVFLPGGDMDDFAEFLRGVEQANPALDRATVHHLVCSYGSECRDVLALAQEDRSLLEPVCDDYPVIKAEILHCVREEMACSLADVMLRRTDLASCGLPGDGVLRTCAELMAAELDWDAARSEREIDQFKAAVAGLAW